MPEARSGGGAGLPDRRAQRLPEAFTAENVPVVSAKLKEPKTKERKFEDVVKNAEQAAVLVLVY
jgi:hypothetical protein